MCTLSKKKGLSIGKDGETLNKAQCLQSKIAKIARNEAVGRKLEKYYALVVFDGDDMGNWWRGGNDHLRLGVSLEEFHKVLTLCLAEFAKAVDLEYKSDDHRGWVIYAGGDDFLGFFNLHHLAKELEFLRETYRIIVSDQLSKFIVEEKELTFSTGVCIAHYKEPLSLVLAQARNLEHRAKDLDKLKKNAIGVGVIPGSGQTAAAVLPAAQFRYLTKIIEDLRCGDFSNAFVGKARTELISLADRESHNLPDDLKGVAKRLLDRAVSRACNLQRIETESDENFWIRKANRIVELQAAVNTLFEKSNDLSNFLDALDIADFIERQTYTSLKTTEPAK
jgi:CRISPR-associated protein Cmr2